MVDISIATLLDSGLISTIVGGIIAIGASVATTSWFNSQHDLKVRKALVNALLFRVLEATDELKKIHQHIADSITENGTVVVPVNEYVSRVMELLGFNELSLDVNAEELGVLNKNKHNDLVGRIVELVRARNIAVRMLAKYNDIKKSLDDEMVELGKFRTEGGKIFLEAGFNPSEHPSLMGKIHKANTLIGQLFEMCEAACGTMGPLLLDINEALPEYFPRHVKLKKIALVEPAGSRE